MVILPVRIRPNLNNEIPHDRAFLYLIRWTAVFCLVDGCWGMFASDLIMNDTLLSVFSFFFHLSAAFTPLVWLNYVLVYLGGIRHEKLYRCAAITLFSVEGILIIVNIFNKMLFYVDASGAYASTKTRSLLFYMQYLTYILIAVFSTVRYLSGKKEEKRSDTPSAITRSSYLYVIMFVAAPILTGIFQLLYPDAPAYSIGYTLGCCIIFSFVITDMLNARLMEQTALQAASRAKTDFLFHMSHDIRTPMNAISGFTAIAKKNTENPEKVAECLHKIDVAGQQLLTLINQVLEMSRIESGKETLQEEPMSIRAEYGALTTVLSAQAAANGIEFDCMPEDIRHDAVCADRAKLNSIAMNIAGNAIKYTKRGGRVTLRLREIPSEEEERPVYRFTVEDTGIGMSLEYQKKLFRPFERDSSPEVNKIQGTGLGLSIVKRFVDLMGGTVSVQSELGHGTRFDILLPLKIAPPEAAAADTEAKKEAFSLRGRRALLVEDNEMNREIAMDILLTEGIEAEQAEDGAAAVDILRKKGADYYDFILMDIQMPIMDGYAATRAIRRLYPEARLPIIALSANAFAEDKQTSLAAGMNDHVAKPIRIPELTKTLQKWL